MIHRVKKDKYEMIRILQWLPGKCLYANDKGTHPSTGDPETD